MNLENAAKALVEYGYADEYADNDHGDYLIMPKIGPWETLEPFRNEAQRNALIDHYKIQRIWNGHEWVSWRFTRNKHAKCSKSNYPIDAENACLESCLDE